MAVPSGAMAPKPSEQVIKSPASVPKDEEQDARRRRMLHETVRIEPSQECLTHLAEVYANPEFAQCVRTITFTLAGWPETDAMVLQTNHELLKKVLTGFTHVERLNLANISWDTLPSDTVSLLLGFAKLTSLSLHEVTFHSNVQFESTILAYPNLTTLLIDEVRWSETLPFPPFTSTSEMSLNLTSLRLGKCTSQNAVTERLLCYKFSLEHLEVRWEDFRQTGPLRDLLRTSGNKLQEFRLDLPELVIAQGAEEVEHLEEDLNLEYNTELRFVQFHSIYLNAHPTEDFHVAWVYGPLRKASPQNLRHVTFDVFADGLKSLARFHWEQIAEVFSGPSYTSNPVVEVNAHLMLDWANDNDKVTDENVVSFLKEKMKLLGEDRVIVHPDITC
ncbi:hypothetical protein C8Q75DRAFT_363606 [Abortiporus biennis]|nr:hypothetical protein C8Q75DRAFT_363606 [Abortiporus biennis]